MKKHEKEIFNSDHIWKWFCLSYSVMSVLFSAYGTNDPEYERTKDIQSDLTFDYIQGNVFTSRGGNSVSFVLTLFGKCFL